MEYAYDDNGNLISDINRGMSMAYNCLSLPDTISIANNGTITFCYDANAAKKSLTYNSGSDVTKIEYLNDIIYKDGLPKYVITETGYLALDDNVYRFYIKDYLGSIRLVKNSTGAVEEINNYYPSGALFAAPVPDVQNYKYSGKELIGYANLGWYDYGARYYDPVLMRWHSADPLLEKYYDTSPYAFCSNNFVNFVDLDGNAWETFWDLASLSAGVKSFAENVKAGNVGAAVFDGIGIIADAAAVLAPGVPGGVGASIAAVRTGGHITDVLNIADGANKTVKSVDNLKSLRKGPKPNYGVSKPHGKYDHNAEIDDFIETLKLDMKNTDIRKNQVQVDVNGNVVGNNRPDVQWNHDGVHYILEVDRTEINSERHRFVIQNNDPYSVFEKRIITGYEVFNQ
ncbi:MAG: hypothetical protein IJX11_05775 [Bacteroidales bacterium]|nr:hypothetical protein [Bacteroidales bacterium]